MRKLIILNILLVLFAINSCEKVVSVTPPEAPPPNGSFFISTNPQGFKIYMEGKDRLRATPDSIRWLETGSYIITLKRDLFLDSAFTIDVTEGQKTEVFIDYTINPKFRGQIFVESNPIEAEIFLNDSATSLRTPATLTNLMPGLYKVTLRKKDHSDYIFYQEVSSNRTVKLKSTLIDITMWEYFNTGNSGISANVLYSITVDNKDNLWMGSRVGLLKYNGFSWESFLPGSSDLPHPVVLYTQADEKNRIWALTVGGIAIFENDTVIARFTSSGGMTALATGFGTDSVKTTLVRSGSPYYFTTDIGLGIIGEFENLRFSPEFSTIPNTNNKLTALEKFDDNTLLIGTAESGLIIYKGSEDIQIFNRTNSIIPGNNISAMYKSNEGVWIGHLPGSGNGGGLSLYNGTKFNVYNLGVPPPRITCIFVSSKGIKFIGTNIGLFVFNEFENKVLMDEETSGLPIKKITGITEDSFGNIWLTTAENGLFKLKKIPF